MFKTPFPKARLLPTLTFECEGGTVACFDAPDTPLGKMEVIGVFDGYDMAGMPVKYDAIEVTLNDGTVVPCTRIHDPNSNYAICQAFSFIPR